MLRDAFFLAGRDARNMLRRRETLLWTFLMPIVFFYFIGTITGGNRRGGGDRDSIIVRTAGEPGFLADQLVRRLEDRKFRIVRSDREGDFARIGRRVTIPAGFTESVLARKPVKVEFERKGGGLGSNYDEIRVGRAVYSVLADLIVAGEKNEKPTAESLAALAARPRPLTLAVDRAGKRTTIPSGFEQAVPGTMVMFTILVMFTSGAVSLVIERNQGLLRRLASSPMARASVMLGKWGARMALGVIQIAFAMLTGSLLFHVNWGPHIGALTAVMLAYGALAAALGMLLGNFGRTDGQVIAFGVIASNVMAALGGCWWPIEVTPEWNQKLAIFLPTGLAMDALHKLVSFGDGPASVAPHVAVMLLVAAGAGAIIARKFRFQ